MSDLNSFVFFYCRIQIYSCMVKLPQVHGGGVAESAVVEGDDVHAQGGEHPATWRVGGVEGKDITYIRRQCAGESREAMLIFLPCSEALFPRVGRALLICWNFSPNRWLLLAVTMIKPVDWRKCRHLHSLAQSFYVCYVFGLKECLLDPSTALYLYRRSEIAYTSI